MYVCTCVCVGLPPPFEEVPQLHRTVPPDHVVVDVDFLEEFHHVAFVFVFGHLLVFVGVCVNIFGEMRRVMR